MCCCLLLLLLQLLLLHLLHLLLMLLASIECLLLRWVLIIFQISALEIARIEVVSYGYLIWNWDCWWWKNLFLFDSLRLLLLLFQLFLFLHTFAASLNFWQSFTHIVKLKVGTRFRTRILLVTLFFGVNAFVVSEVDIINVVMIISHLMCVFPRLNWSAAVVAYAFVS